LIVEVNGSCAARDLGVKLELYRRAGVREYLTVLLQPNRIVWRELVDDRYEEIAPEPDGLLRSRVFPGLWLDPAAVWDPAQSLRTAVESGAASPEHAAFVRRLAAYRRR
jgi:Uma2 family endonuclease